jgi:hypothetical protein
MVAGMPLWLLYKVEAFNEDFWEIFKLNKKPKPTPKNPSEHP